MNKLTGSIGLWLLSLVFASLIEAQTTYSFSDGSNTASVPGSMYPQRESAGNGEFEFELSTKVTQKGYQHLTFYKAAGAKAGKPLGGVYFGTNEQMNAIKELDVSYYLD